MAPLDDTHSDPALEALLRSARPAPMTAWADELEATLIPARAKHPARRRSLAGLVAAGGLAAVFVVAGLVGGGPLASDGGDDARARPGCTVVYVTKAAPVGQVVRKADGTVTVETTTKPVTRAQQRCK